MTTEKKLRKLLAKADGYLGMLGEARAKARLLSERLRARHEDGVDTVEDYEEAGRQLRRMAADVAKYGRKLARIRDIFRDHGLLADVD